MQLNRLTRDRVILTVLFGSAGILLVIALILWRQGSDSESSGSGLEGRPSDALGLPPAALPTEAEEAALQKLLAGGSLTASGGRGAPHRVTVKASSPGLMYLGFIYRDGKGAGVYVKDRGFQETHVVKGELTAAIIAIQVLEAPATCEITIDGKKAVSDTQRVPGEYALCVA